MGNKVRYIWTSIDFEDCYTSVRINFEDDFNIEVRIKKGSTETDVARIFYEIANAFNNRSNQK